MAGEFRYEFVKRIGAGSFGQAVLIKNSSGELFVSKEINLNSLKDRPAERERQRAEASILASLRHPNIIGYHEAYINDGIFYIIQEYADRGDLRDEIRRRRGEPGGWPAARFTEADVLCIFSQLCEALSYLHEKSILHRDIKSENAFLTSSGAVKLGDFGIARVLGRDTAAEAAAKTVCGTLNYMSPELCLAKPYGEKADAWALGCVLFEMCNSETPFPPSLGAARVVQAVVNSPHPKLVLPKGASGSIPWQKIVRSERTVEIDGLLVKNPDQRWGVPDVLRLEAFQQHPRQCPVCRKNHEVARARRAAMAASGAVPRAPPSATPPPPASNNSSGQPSTQQRSQQQRQQQQQAQPQQQQQPVRVTSPNGQNSSATVTGGGKGTQQSPHPATVPGRQRAAQVQPHFYVPQQLPQQFNASSPNGGQSQPPAAPQQPQPPQQQSSAPQQYQQQYQQQQQQQQQLLGIPSQPRGHSNASRTSQRDSARSRASAPLVSPPNSSVSAPGIGMSGGGGGPASHNPYGSLGSSAARGARSGGGGAAGRPQPSENPYSTRASTPPSSSQPRRRAASSQSPPGGLDFLRGQPPPSGAAVAPGSRRRSGAGGYGEPSSRPQSAGGDFSGGWPGVSSPPSRGVGGVGSPAMGSSGGAQRRGSRPGDGEVSTSPVVVGSVSPSRSGDRRKTSKSKGRSRSRSQATSGRRGGSGSDLDSDDERALARIREAKALYSELHGK